MYFFYFSLLDDFFSSSFVKRWLHQHRVEHFASSFKLFFIPTQSLQFTSEEALLDVMAIFFTKSTEIWWLGYYYRLRAVLVCFDHRGCRVCKNCWGIGLVWHTNQRRFCEQSPLWIFLFYYLSFFSYRH